MALLASRVCLTIRLQNGYGQTEVAIPEKLSWPKISSTGWSYQYLSTAILVSEQGCEIYFTTKHRNGMCVRGGVRTKEPLIGWQSCYKWAIRPAAATINQMCLNVFDFLYFIFWRKKHTIQTTSQKLYSFYENYMFAFLRTPCYYWGYNNSFYNC